MARSPGSAGLPWRHPGSEAILCGHESYGCPITLDLPSRRLFARFSTCRRIVNLGEKLSLDRQGLLHGWAAIYRGFEQAEGAGSPESA